MEALSGTSPTTCLNNLKDFIMLGFSNSGSVIFDGLIQKPDPGSHPVVNAMENVMRPTTRLYFVTIVTRCTH